MTYLQEKHALDSGTPVWVSGAGRAVILVHGVLVDHRMWQAQVDALSPYYRVCGIDMLGHGEAPDPPGERTLADFVDQVDEVVDRFSDMRPPVLGGFSMGGLIAQAYAVQHHGKLGGLVLMNTVHDRSPEQSATVRERFADNVSRGVENAIESGTRRWFKPQDYETHGDAIARTIDQMRSGDFTAKRKAHRVFAHCDAEVTGKLGAVSCPALVMTGAQDTGSTPEMAQKMANALPDAELHILDGQHHMMPVLDADRVNGILLKFLSKRVKDQEPVQPKLR